MNLKPYTSILVAIAFSPFAQAQPDAKSVTRAAAKACNELRSAEFSIDATFASTKVKASVWQLSARVPDSGYAPGKYRVKGTSEEKAGNLTFFDFAYDGKALQIRGSNDDVEVIDHPNAAQAGQFTPMSAVMTRLSVVGDGFAQMLADKPEIRLLKPKTIGAWTCDVVEIKRKVSNPVAGDAVIVVRWAIDRKTHLPVQRSSDFATVTITKLTLNPALDEKMFRLDAKVVKAANPLGPGTDLLLPIGAAAPKFSIKDQKGKLHTLADYKGRVLVLDFWATWCLPCRKTMPILQRLHKKYGSSGVAVLGVSVDAQGDPATFMKRMGYSYPIALRGGPMSKGYRVELLPTLYVIGPDGRIRYRQAGTNPEDEKGLPAAALSARGREPKPRK